MKLEKKDILFIGFMLFSMFFGAGNLIFPPFLGQSSAENMIPAMIGFLATAVILPVLGVIVVSEADGLDRLANRVNTKFSLIYTILIYISIGPGLGIPRAGSVPFEMAVAPYLPKDTNLTLVMFIYSFVFFAVSAWLTMNPSKMIDRLGSILTPILLILILFMFGAFLLKGHVDISTAQPEYQTLPFLKGFCEGYQTMDAIGALNFGLVIAVTLHERGVKKKKDVVSYTLKTGLIAGVVLAIVYIMLTYMGAASSGVYSLQENGAWTLRCVVNQLFGEAGAIILAAIFILACLTTCVGLIASISEYFAGLWPRFSYKQYVLIITAISFIICNQGLTTILNVSVPILSAIYPMSIMLILLGLSDKWIKNNTYIYPFTIFGVGIISILFAFEEAGVSLGAFGTLLTHLPFYSLGFGWVTIAIVMIILSYVFAKIHPNKVQSVKSI